MGLELTRMEATQGMKWDEPKHAASPRGWLMAGGTCVGFYLDYGPDSHRPPHWSMIATINGPMGRIWCTPDSLCRRCQPGHILACRYPDGPGSEQPRGSRYVETVEQAREYVETGELAQAVSVDA